MMKEAVSSVLLVFALCANPKASFEAWHNSDKWDVAGDAVLNP